MATYIARRAMLVPPVLIGVVTITFVLFTSLPIEDQLVSHFGEPNAKERCGYLPSCPCNQLNPSAVKGNTCTCISPPTVTTKTGVCANPRYQDDVAKLGLNQPAWEQWGIYIYRAFTFQWGNVSNSSTVAGAVPQIDGLSVATAISWELPYTMELAVISLIIILAIAIPLGNASAVNRNRPIDQASRVMSFSGFAIPGFLLGSFLVLGMVLLVLPHTGFLVKTPWCHAGEPLDEEFTYSLPPAPNACYGALPTGQYYPYWIANGVRSTPTGFLTVDALLHGDYWLSLDSVMRILLPALVIAYGTIAGLLRFVRNSMLEVMNLDYIRTARAKGVEESVVTRRHAGKNSMNVTITVLGLTFAGFLGGFPVIEEVFHLNGVGYMLAEAVNPAQGLDYAVIFGSTLLFTFLIVAANLIVDILYAYLDPRVRLG
jgi:ABC-type dipeptide/oligopeptide/nickel transport system permease component